MHRETILWFPVFLFVPGVCKQLRKQLRRLQVLRYQELCVVASIVRGVEGLRLSYTLTA